MDTLNPRLRDWHGRTVWLVGCSSGIGAALARALSDRGARLVLSARRPALLEQLAAGHADRFVLPMDVTRPDDWTSAMQTLADADFLPDTLIYCAADYRPEAVTSLVASQVRQTLDVNLTGVFHALEHLLPRFLHAGGNLVLIASVAGYAGLPRAGVYGPSKAALINLAELLYAELRPQGIGVYLVNPGFVKTPLTDKNRFAMPALLGADDAARRILEGLAKGRFEIHFPRRFTLWLKLFRLLPYRIRFALLSRLMRR